MPILRRGRSSGSPSRPRRAALIGALTVFAVACAGETPPAPKTAASAPAAPGAAARLAPSAAPVKLLATAEARSIELAAISVTSLDRLLTNGATLVAKAVPLPIDPSQLRDMLLGQAGLSPEISANLDLGAPSGAAIVSTGSVGGTGAVMAVAARGPEQAARVLTLLGKVVERRGDVVMIDNGMGGRGWLYRDGAIIVFSDEIEALARGARLAEEARHAVAEDVTAVLYPDTIARANGTDVKSALAALMAQVEAAQTAQTPGGGAAHQLESFSEMVSLVGDAEAVELGLAVDAATVARHYAGTIDGFVLDREDAESESRLSLPVLVTDTLMRSFDDKRNLAEACLRFCAELCRARRR